MKVRTFTGSETAKVDKRVNDWLAKFGIKPHHTNTAIGQFTVKAEDQHTGKPVNRRVAVIAISVWYEEPPQQDEANEPPHDDQVVSVDAARPSAT